MHNTRPSHAQNLYTIISEGYELPTDDYKHHQWLKPLKLRKGSKSEDNFYQLLEQTFLDPSKGGRNNTQVENLRRHWKVLLLNLSFVMYQRHWLLIPQDSKYYSDSFYPRRLGISYRPTRHIVEWLQEHDYVVLLPGRKYKDQPAKARVFPTPKLMELLWSYFLEIEQPIEAPYLIINEPEGKWESIADLPADHPEKQELATINEFLKPHQWACKGPVQLKYKSNAFQGGRLYTPFQSLPDRRMRLRINTLIDGENICEVDFSANHLRLNLAFNGGVDAGDDPYRTVGEEAGIEPRELVKKFFTIAMGGDNEVGALHACFTEGISMENFQKLKEASLKVFPKLELFNGWGIYAQNFEGQILKNVMLEGVKEGIVCLPVHDAVAVPLDHIGWACDEMRYQWDKQMDVSGLSRVTTDIPA